MKRAATIAILLLACSSGDQQELDKDRAIADAGNTDGAGCLATPSGPVTGEGIGDLRIGIAVDSVKRICEVVSDTTELAEEAMPVRSLVVRVGRDSVRAVVHEGKVWRLETDGAQFRTADSLGVGTPLHRLLNEPGVRGVVGEGQLYILTDSHCGLSFRVESASMLPAMEGDFAADRLAGLPPNTQVDRVLITGCGSERS